MTLNEETVKQNKQYKIEIGYFNREPTTRNEEKGHVSTYEIYYDSPILYSNESMFLDGSVYL